MKGHSLRLLALCSVPLVGACADEGVVGLDGPAVEIEVAPLTLPGATDVCYGIYVQNGSGQVVDALNNICSSQYGNNGGGDISYVVPCDASAGNQVHTVTLVLEGFKTAPNTWADETQYKNPCGWAANTSLPLTNPAVYPSDTTSTPPGIDSSVNYDGTICQRTFTCQENEDVLVRFDLTVMRDADQGFFDVAVNFEDIFCSAKFDSCYDNNVPIELLFGDDTDTDTDLPDAVGDESGRDRTGVFAMACSAGAGKDIKTDILMSKVVVNCPSPTGSFTLPLSGLDPATGNQYVTIDADGNAQVDDKVQYAIYAGNESLDCGTEGPCNKAYYNLAINLEDLPEGCTLSLQATAQDANNPAFTGGSVTSMATSGTTYPFVQVNGANLKQTECVQDGLNDGGSVSTFFGSSMNGGTKPTLMCDHSLDGAGAAAIEASLDYPENQYSQTTPDTYSLLSGFGKIRAQLVSKCANSSMISRPETAYWAQYVGDFSVNRYWNYTNFTLTDSQNRAVSADLLGKFNAFSNGVGYAVTLGGEYPEIGQSIMLEKTGLSEFAKANRQDLWKQNAQGFLVAPTKIFIGGGFYGYADQDLEDIGKLYTSDTVYVNIVSSFTAN